MLQKNKIYVEILKDELARRQNINAKYSLRSYAQTLGIHSSSLSAILKGKRNLPINYAETFVDILKLDFEKKKAFINSVRSEQLRIQKIPMPDVEVIKLAGSEESVPEQYNHIPEELRHFVSLNVVTTESKIAGAKKILEEMKAKLYVYLKNIDNGEEPLKRVSLSISLYPESSDEGLKRYDSVSSSPLT